MSNTEKKYIVRGGSRKSNYIKHRVNMKNTRRKWAWTKHRSDACVFTVKQANAIAGAYGGEVYCIE